MTLAVGDVFHVSEQTDARDLARECNAAIVTELPRVSTGRFAATAFPPNRPPRAIYLDIYGNDWHERHECPSRKPCEHVNTNRSASDFAPDARGAYVPVAYETRCADCGIPIDIHDVMTDDLDNMSSFCLCHDAAVCPDAYESRHRCI